MAGSRNQHCANLYRHTFVPYQYVRAIFCLSAIFSPALFPSLFSTHLHFPTNPPSRLYFSYITFEFKLDGKFGGALYAGRCPAVFHQHSKVRDIYSIKCCRLL